jgi:hypothetical protein
VKSYSLWYFLVALSLLACGGETQGSGGASASDHGGHSTSTTGSNAGGGGSANVGGSGGANVGGSGGANSGGSGGANVGGSGSAERLVGEWKPTGISDSNMPIQPTPPNAPYFVFEQNGDLRLGCGTEPAGTWVWDDNGPGSSVGVLHVTLGGSVEIDWYVVELDDQVFTFAEGGDVFYFARSQCP